MAAGHGRHRRVVHGSHRDGKRRRRRLAGVAAVIARQRNDRIRIDAGIALVIDGNGQRIGAAEVRCAEIGDRGERSVDVGNGSAKHHACVAAAVARGEAQVRRTGQRKHAIGHGKRDLHGIAAARIRVGDADAGDGQRHFLGGEAVCRQDDGRRVVDGGDSDAEDAARLETAAGVRQGEREAVGRSFTAVVNVGNDPRLQVCLGESAACGQCRPVELQLTVGHVAGDAELQLVVGVVRVVAKQIGVVNNLGRALIGGERCLDVGWCCRVVGSAVVVGKGAAQAGVLYQNGVVIDCQYGDGCRARSG